MWYYYYLWCRLKAAEYSKEIPMSPLQSSDQNEPTGHMKCGSFMSSLRHINSNSNSSSSSFCWFWFWFMRHSGWNYHHPRHSRWLFCRRLYRDPQMTSNMLKLPVLMSAIPYQPFFLGAIQNIIENIHVSLPKCNLHIRKWMKSSLQQYLWVLLENILDLFWSSQNRCFQESNRLFGATEQPSTDYTGGIGNLVSPFTYAH